MRKSQLVSRVGIFLAMAVVLSACSDSYHSKLGMLSTLMHLMQIGKGQDQWLQKRDFVDGGWDKVALIFGYIDDYDACTEIAGALRKSYPQWQYRCTPAN